VTPELDIAAVVVAYNGGDELLDCLRSLLAQTVPDLEVIVVDNASTDGSIERAEATFGARIRVIRRATNGGYAAGSNTGWRATDARIVTILNQDLTFEPECLERMCRVLMDEPREALVSPKLVLKSDPGRVNAIGNDVHLSGVTWCHGLGTPAADWHGTVQVTAISGAAFMARRSFLDRLGGLEEAYFMYMEDVDLSLRARLTGGVCLAACDAVATHSWTLSLTPEKFGLLERNRRILWRRILDDGGQRRQLILLQAETLGWLYAIVHGRAYVAAKARSAHALRAARRIGLREEAAHELAHELAPGLPYSTVMPASPAISIAGGFIDRVVVRMAGIFRERHAKRCWSTQRPE
jgi:GT2 family glycosyltransferase